MTDPRPGEAASALVPGPGVSRVALWRAGFTMAAIVILIVVALGASFWFAQVRRWEEHNQVAVALGTLRAMARILDRYHDQEGRYPQTGYEQLVSVLSPLTRPKSDPLYKTVQDDDRPFLYYFTHAQAPGGVCTDSEIGRYRHEVAGLVDPFGKPYQYLLDQPASYTTGLVLSRKQGYVLNTPGATRCAYVLVSNGFDRKFGTEDDILVTSETPPALKEMIPTLGRPWSD